ncbi:formate-dependent phosphoribosylglycinamide formyltransferase [Buchananella felis]|uniref:formate-dependent phosphoribosylglycinamide formyltransferase n=1 Tax=Buchananella felis TaxID=3231492 RepID=UPI003528D2A9
MSITLGTPWSESATRVLLLGSGELGKEVAIALTRLGVEVTAVDRYEGAPAQQVAHNAMVIDMLDPVAVKEAIRASRAQVVVPEIEAIATGALAELEAAGEVRVVPTARTTQLTMDREGIRRLAAEELGLPTSAYRFASCLEEVQAAVEAVGLPAVIKPVMSSSGKGQSVVRTAQDVAGAWEYAQSGARTGGRGEVSRVIVEGFVDFDYEITLLTVRSRAADGGTVTSVCAPIGHRQVDGDYVESWQPHPMNDAALERAKEVATAITGALGGWGVFGVELFVKGEQVIFSEVSPRPHDTGLVTLATQRFSEFELHARAILGLPVDTSLVSPGASAVLKSPGEGVASFTGVEAAVADPRVELRLFGKPTATPGRRLGVVAARAGSVAEARELVARTAAGIGIELS